MVKKLEENGITTTKVVKEIYKKECPECGLILTSEYKNQLKYNFDIHHQSCKRKARLKKQKEEK